MNQNFNQPPRNTKEEEISPSVFSDVIKEAQARNSFNKIITQDMQIPNFPSKTKAVWNMNFLNGRLRGVLLKINKEDTSENLVEIGIHDSYDGDMKTSDLVPHYFVTRHRFVHTENMTDEEKKIKGIGSFALQKAEEVVRLFVKELKDPLTTNEIGMITNQLDVFKFAQNNNYQLHNEKQKIRYHHLMQEIKEHQEDTNFTEKGILPHYRFVDVQYDTPDGIAYTIKGTVIDLEKLKRYCDNKEPNYEEYSHLLQGDNNQITVDIGDYSIRHNNIHTDEPHPFFVDFYLSKQL